MKRKLAVCILSLPLAILGRAAVGAEPVDIEARPSITVHGEGKASAAPDIVHITMGVETQAEQAQQALAANTEAMRQLIDTLDSQGVPKKNIQTVAFNIFPQYQNDQPQRGGNIQPSTPRILGYRVTNQVRIKLNKIEMLGELLDQVVGVGANSIHGIEFGIEASDAIRDKARESAVKDARRKAELLASAAGVTLGAPLRISESSGSDHPQPMHRMSMMAESSVPIAEGEQQLSANVTVVYAIE